MIKRHHRSAALNYSFNYAEGMEEIPPLTGEPQVNVILDGSWTVVVKPSLSPSPSESARFCIYPGNLFDMPSVDRACQVLVSVGIEVISS